MGTAPPSKPAETPAKPFQRHQRRACLAGAFLPKPRRKGPSVLLQLIARREWQKVLIRVTLFPAEVSQRQKMTWYGVEWSLLPLHLACALQPPPPVVAMLLYFHADTARVRMNRCRRMEKKRRRWRRPKKRKSFTSSTTQENTLPHSNEGVPMNDTAPSSDEDEGHEDELDVVHISYRDSVEYSDEDSNEDETEHLLPEALQDSVFSFGESGNSIHVFESEDTDSEVGSPRPLKPLTQVEDSTERDDTTAETSKKSLRTFLGRHGLTLQLEADGSLVPLSVESLDLPSQPSKMHWNLEPMLMEANELLPLHIACLYRAAPQVIEQLLAAYPKGALEKALGMLPIHMVCAGFDLPPPVMAPPSQVPFPIEDEFDMAESLVLLVKAYPQSLDYPSENNGMTPQMYIEEIMDDGAEKNRCLHIVGVNLAATETDLTNEIEARTSDGETTSSGTMPRMLMPVEVIWEEDNGTIPSIQPESSSRYLGESLPQFNGLSGTPLYTRMVVRDWQAALDMTEENPEQATEWQYGIELDRLESSDNPQLWKRLPIHSACVLHAPVGVIEALASAYPKGLETKDPFTGALPLHEACRHSAPPEVVKAVLAAHHVGACVKDFHGRLALHLACLSGASRLTFIYLLKAYPQAVLLKDDKRKIPLQYAKMNPTLREETIDLLELVQSFLTKHPGKSKNYTFTGFESPQRTIRSEASDSSVSGFYESDDHAVEENHPRADEELQVLSSTGLQSCGEEKGQGEEAVSDTKDPSVGHALVNTLRSYVYGVSDSPAEQSGEKESLLGSLRTLEEDELYTFTDDVVTSREDDHFANATMETEHDLTADSKKEEEEPEPTTIVETEPEEEERYSLAKEYAEADQRDIATTKTEDEVVVEDDEKHEDQELTFDVAVESVQPVEKTEIGISTGTGTSLAVDVNPDDVEMAQDQAAATTESNAELATKDQSGDTETDVFSGELSSTQQDQSETETQGSDSMQAAETEQGELAELSEFSCSFKGGEDESQASLEIPEPEDELRSHSRSGSRIEYSRLDSSSSFGTGSELWSSEASDMQSAAYSSDAYSNEDFISFADISVMMKEEPDASAGPVSTDNPSTDGPTFPLQEVQEKGSAGDLLLSTTVSEAERLMIDSCAVQERDDQHNRDRQSPEDIHAC